VGDESYVRFSNDMLVVDEGEKSSGSLYANERL